ncbi:MAG: hemerythrin family protein [Fibrobacterota bacterium]|nr:hemerythrin family protein [Fibrobacterota bacterium]QQS06994.1 MAG: hemerythrin family protein [Fibrobacterota bacterium]
MPTAIWTDDIETGFDNIDAQHRALFSLMGEIDVEMGGGTPANSIGGRFRQLLEFTDLHFATEERLMRKLSYEELDSHAKAHLDLRERITEATTRDLDGHDLHSELMSILSAWLVEHIHAHDLPMALWMRSLSQHEDPPSTIHPETQP